MSSSFQEEDLDISIVKETPFSNSSQTSPNSGSLFKSNSDSTTIHDSADFSDQLLSPQSKSLHNPGITLSIAQCSTVTTTPEREAPTDASILKPERETLLNSSVNSHIHKRRKVMASPLVIDLEDGSCMVNSDSNSRIEFDPDNYFSQILEKEDTPLQRMENNSALSEPSSSAVEERFRVSCSLCRSPLGLPRENLLISGLLSSSSKVHLVSLLEGKTEPSQENKSTSIPVIISDISSVDPLIYGSAPWGTPQKGTWSEEDGCVFKTIFCPFCSSKNCLGVQILATDASNTHLLNKVCP